MLKEKSSNIVSPPSSSQSTPTKKKPASPTHLFNKHPSSPMRNSSKTFGSHHQYPSNSFSPPFYKNNSWMNLSQTPPPPHHMPPLFGSSGLFYPPQHGGSSHHFSRSHPMPMPPHKFKPWQNGAGYPRNDRSSHWFSHRAMARV